MTTAAVWHHGCGNLLVILPQFCYLRNNDIARIHKGLRLARRRVSGASFFGEAHSRLTSQEVVDDATSYMCITNVRLMNIFVAKFESSCQSLRWLPI